MLQKAIIEQKIDKYSMKVRIPVYNKIKSDPTATPTEELYTAIIQTLPGCSPVYQEGDLVLVAFENENLAYPVIIGLLYRENMSQGSTDVIADSLKVNVNSDLTENTFIGYVTPDAIKKLNDKYQNNVKKVVVEYSLSNYEDHYDQFSQWSEQAPQFWPGKFMWQRTTVTYENDLITRSMTCIQGAKGDPGSSITIVDNYVKYAINNSGTEHPSTSAQNVWYENPPQTTDVNPYLWSWTYVLFSDGTSNDTFSVSRTSANSIIVYLYKRSDTEISQIDWSNTLTYNFDTKRFSTLPTGWSSDIPSGNDPIYVTAATVSSVNTQGYVPAASWSTPMLFTKSGFNSKTIQLYKRSATAPSAPSTTVTYTFSTGAISPSSPNGWSLGVPTSNGNPCYVVQATAISYEDTDTITSGEWSSPTVIAQDGSSDYIDQPIVDWYIATSNTNVPTTPTSDIEVASEWTTLGWTNNINSIILSETNKYLWNAEVTHYSITGYVKTNAHIITVYAESGAGILSSTIYYYVDTQGATPPADSASWSTTFPSSIQQGQYLWTKTVTEYTDTSMPDSVVYSVSRDGETGSDGKGITSIVEYYAINNSDTTPPSAGSSDWHTTPMNPTSSNRYLWSYQVISYTTGSPTTTTPHVISMYVEDGAAGSNAATVFLYQRAESASSLTKPSSTLTYTFSTGVLSGTLGNWTQTIPATNGNPCFVIQATAIGTGTTDTIASSEWSNIVKLIEDGQDGSDGKNTAVVYLYKRAASASIDWTSDLTYSFTTNSLTSTPSGWSASVPLGTDPLYMTAATASSTTSSDTIPYTEWATPVVLAQNGTDGDDGSSSATVFLYQRAASASSITKPSSTLTYTFATGVLSGTLGNWSQTIPASNGNPCFAIQATAIGTGATDTIASSEWSAIVKLVEDGQNGVGITSSSVNYAVSSSGSSIPESGWSPTFPSTITQGDYLWTRTITSYSDGNSSTVYSVSRDGVNGSPGDPGQNGLNTAIVYLYKRSSSAATIDWTSNLTYNFSDKALTSTPTGWSQTVPSGTNPIYVTAATASSRTNTDSIAYTEWSSPVVLAENGSNGTDGMNTATVFLYQRAASASSLSKPSSTLTYTFATGTLSGTLGNWSQTFPAVTGNPCFVIQATAVSNTATDTIASSEWSDITKIVEDGEDGVGITSSSVMYAVSSDGSTAPSTGWQSTIPTLAQGDYLWTRTITTYSDTTSSTAYSVSREGVNGTNGTNGLNNALVYLYKRSSTAATVDWTSNLTYNFTNKSLTSTPTGWSQTITSGSDPLYITAATASSRTNTDSIAYTEWSTPVVFTENGTNGTDGMNTATVFLYQRAESSSGLSKPSSTLTYTFSTGVLSGTLGNWSQSIPASDGNPCFVIQATAIGTGTTDTIASSEWSNIVELVSDGQDGTNGISITGVTEYFAVNNSNTTAPTSGWSTSFTAPTSSNKYLWNYERITYSSGSPTDTTPAVIGMYSADGNDGRSITGVVNYYLATNADSGVTTSTPGWTTTVQSVSQSAKYLWNYEVTQYDSGSPTTTSPCIIGAYGDTGAAGTNGLNTATVYLYKRSSSAATINWTNTLTYTFATHLLSSVPTGWNVSIPSGTDPLYVTAATASSNTATDDIAYTEWASPVILAENGTDGDDGANSATVFLYQRAASSSSISKPSGNLTYTFATGTLSGTLGNWTQTIPTSDGNPCFVIQATAVSASATDTIASSEWSNIVELVSDGQDGAPGTNGLNNAIVYLYKRSSSAVTVDWTSDLTYNFTNKALTSVPTGWSETIPSGSNPIYVTAASASSNTSTDTIAYTEWATPVILAQNGSDGSKGSNAATVFLYQRGASASSLTKPSSNLTYTFSTGVLSGTLGNWSQTIPATDGNPCFVIQATAVSTSTTDSIGPSEWSSIVKLIEDGQDGSPGTNGLNNAVVYLYKRSSSAATIDWTSTLTYNFENKALTSTPTGWSETIPSGTNPIYVTAASASSNTSTDTIAYTEWATPVILAQNGANGTNGRSITGVINYYLATDQDSGVTRSTSGWTTTIQNVTSTNKYLWNYEEITYSSGSPTYTDPCIIGAYGDNGATGVGISSITEYYALSTTTTRPSSGWSTTLPEMDATNRYLWNYSVITYTNGSSSGTSSDALIIGVYGDSVISLEIQSDNGTLFNSKTLSSTLSAVVYLGAAQLTVASNGTVTNGGTTVGQLNWFAKERFVGNGTAVTFDTGLDILNYNNNPTIEITIDGTVTTAYSVSDQNTIVFTTAPTDGSVIIISYLTSTSGSLLVQRTDVRNQIVVTCKLVSGVNTIATAEVTIKDLNDATSLQSWYMLTVPDAQFISLPTVVYDSSNYTVVPTGSYSYQLLDPNTQQYVEYTATFTWENVAPSVDIQTGSNITCVCYSFQMIIFYDNSCSAGTVERNATFDSAVSAYYQAQDASNAANQAQSTANEAADGVQSNSDKITGIQSTLTAIDGVLASKLDTVVFQPYQENIDSFIQFDVPNSTMTLGKGNFKQQLSSTKNSFMEGPTEIAYISNQELYINNTTINQKLAFDEQWIVTFDNTNGLIIKHV